MNQDNSKPGNVCAGAQSTNALSMCTAPQSVQAQKQPDPFANAMQGDPSKGEMDKYVSECEHARPIVKFTLETYNLIRTMIDVTPHSTEISWYSLVYQKPGNVYLIDGIYIPEQECHGAETESTKNGQIQVWDEVIREGGPEKAKLIRFQAHLHPWAGESISPSQQDIEQNRVFGTVYGYDWFIFAIFNKDMVAKIDFVNFKEGYSWRNLRWYVELPEADPAKVARIEALVKERVKPKNQISANAVNLGEYRSMISHCRYGQTDLFAADRSGRKVCTYGVGTKGNSGEARVTDVSQYWKEPWPTLE